jgi:hypothetical protein
MTRKLERRVAGGFQRGFLGKPGATRRSAFSALLSNAEFAALARAPLQLGEREEGAENCCRAPSVGNEQFRLAAACGAGYKHGHRRNVFA